MTTEIGTMISSAAVFTVILQSSSWVDTMLNVIMSVDLDERLSSFLG